MSVKQITILGGGLAGSEAALQLASNGLRVQLHEMRPVVKTPAHQTSKMAELVCSNSFGSDTAHSASGILKRELLSLGCQLLPIAYAQRVPAGASLAVDRELFSAQITAALQSHPMIEIVRGEATIIPRDQLTIVATGPLTSQALSQDIRKLVGLESLYFYDAISPIVSADSLEMEELYFGNRYDKGDEKDFLNIPLNEEQYETLVDDLLSGDVMLPHDFEEEKYFEGCMPIEALAARGRRTLAFGPMKPVGLNHPKTGKRAHAVIQLRAENTYRTAYNLVGFQTKLKYPEQLRIFKKLPGLHEAEFLRLGSMHRNTYLNSPRVLAPSLQLNHHPLICIAGQLTGTEGYLESIATGLVAARTCQAIAEGRSPKTLPLTSMLGAILSTITDSTRLNFQPINANFGVLPPLDGNRVRDKTLRNTMHAERSEKTLVDYLA